MGGRGHLGLPVRVAADQTEHGSPRPGALTGHLAPEGVRDRDRGQDVPVDARVELVSCASKDLRTDTECQAGGVGNRPLHRTQKLGEPARGRGGFRTPYLLTQARSDAGLTASRPSPDLPRPRPPIPGARGRSTRMPAVRLRISKALPTYPKAQRRLDSHASPLLAVTASPTRVSAIYLPRHVLTPPMAPVTLRPNFRRPNFRSLGPCLIPTHARNRPRSGDSRAMVRLRPGWGVLRVYQSRYRRFDGTWSSRAVGSTMGPFRGGKRQGWDPNPRTRLYPVSGFQDSTYSAQPCRLMAVCAPGCAPREEIRFSRVEHLDG